MRDRLPRWTLAFVACCLAVAAGDRCLPMAHADPFGFGPTKIGGVGADGNTHATSSDAVNNLGVAAFPPLPSDGPCSRPDAGTSFTCYCPPGTRVRIGANTASLSYRSTLLPDAGLGSSTSDNPVPAGALANGTLVTAALPDGGGEVSLTLSAADPSAGVSSVMGGAQLCQ